MSEQISIGIGTEPMAFPSKEKVNFSDLNNDNDVVTRRRSNSQSQVVAMPGQGLRTVKPPKRKKFHYVVTMSSLNDTFKKKILTVPYFPDVRRLGRPAGVKIKPDSTNGYFDSRVLSRNHAAMYIDPENGKLMLKDMGSSNGTYVNEVKIGTDAVEIKIGDIIYLGFNIQVDTNHKQISAKIDNISVQVNTPNLLERDFRDRSSAEYMYSEFLQGVSSYVNRERSSQKRLYDADEALFGDFNPDFGDYEFEGSKASGRFRNSRIIRSLTVDDIISRLNDSLVKVERQNQVLGSIENFVENYRIKLDDINSQYLNSVIESTKCKYEERLEQESQKVEDERKNTMAAKQILDKFTSTSKTEIENLKKMLSLLEEEKSLLENLLEEHKQREEVNRNYNDRNGYDNIINSKASGNALNENTNENKIDIDFNQLDTNAESKQDSNSPSNDDTNSNMGNHKQEGKPPTACLKSSDSSIMTPPISDSEELKKLEERECDEETTPTKDDAKASPITALNELVPNKILNSGYIDLKRNGVYVSLLVIFLGLVFDRFSK